MAATVRACQRCSGALPAEMHVNAKYCLPCRADLRRRPVSRLTPEQAADLERLSGTMTRNAIATHLGVSRAQISRYLRDHALRSNARDHPDELVQAVCVAYAALGKRETEKLFPGVCVRSITERHYQRLGFPPRQIRWKGEELIDAVRMAGLVSHTAQAAYFRRPNAYNGSIKSLWHKVFHCAPNDINGMAMQHAWMLCGPGIIATLVKQQDKPHPQQTVLWLDLEPALHADVAPWVRNAIAALAQFQRWLFHTTSADTIRQMIREREGTCYGQYQPDTEIPTADTAIGEPPGAL